MKKVVVTGGNGYIGSVLIGYLNDHGYDAVSLDANFFEDSKLYDLPSNHKSIFKDSREITEADLKGAHALVHLAGISNDPLGKLEASKIYDPTREYATKIAKMCKTLGVKFIFASSCSVYGIGSDEYLDESCLTNPQTLYSLNKLQIEEDLASIADSTFNPIALRFATVFGPSPRLRFDLVINMFVGMAVTNRQIVLNSNGLSWRPNLHIHDACKSIGFAIEHNNDGGLLVLNVGSNENNMSILEIAKIVKSNVSNCELRYLVDNPELDKDGLIVDRKIKNGSDNRTYKVDFSKILTVFPQFKCDWSIAEGVAQMVELLGSINFNNDTFKSRGFYRLQQLEHLHQAGLLNDDLKWTNKSK